MLPQVLNLLGPFCAAVVLLACGGSFFTGSH